MKMNEQLIAYLATLFTLAAVFIAALIAAKSGVNGVTIGQAFGLGTITGGLIGVLRAPSFSAAPSSTKTTMEGPGTMTSTTSPAVTQADPPRGNAP